MRLTTYTDYALRVLIYLALKGDNLSTIDEIANKYEISKNHLVKIVHELGMSGYITTIRGKHGGIRLSLAPNKIYIGDVVRYCEQDAVFVECFDKTGGNCKITRSCILRKAFDKAINAFFKELDKFTLADLVLPRKSISKILFIDQ